MKKAKLVVILTLALVLGLVLVLAMVTYAQGPEGEEERVKSQEEGGVGGLGLADPPPAGYTVLYMFSGARDSQNASTNSAATSVHCTNYGSSNALVRVEISDYDNDPTIYCTLATWPGWTVTFSSQNTAVYVWGECAMSTTDDIDQGSGRIMANSSSAQIICTAQVLDPTNNPPEYMINLDLFRP